MFGAIGRYIYDRRRGLFKTAGVVGAVYVAGKYVIQRLEEIKETVLTERNAKENLRRRFQQNMQDCTYTIMAYMPTLATRILEELDVERISVELQKRSKASMIKAKEESAQSPQSQHTGTGSDNDNGSMADSRLSASLISAAELESNSSASVSGSGVYVAPPTPSDGENQVKDAAQQGGEPGSPAPSSSAKLFSEGQNTSSFLSNLESTEPFTSSLPLSSNMPSTTASHTGADAAPGLESSMTSWVNFKPDSTPSTSQHADDEKAPAASANLPVIPDLELPTVDLAAVSVVDTQSSGVPKSQQSQSALSYTDDVPEGQEGQGSLQRKSKAELWHELKIMSFTRLLVIFYSTTLLSLQIHVQLSLIGRHKYVQSVREAERQERKRVKEQEQTESLESLGLVGSMINSAPSILSGMTSLGLVPQPQSSLNEHEEEEEIEEDVDEDTERKYLTLSWWLLHIGWRDISSRVRGAVEDVLQGVSLKSRLNMDDLRGLMVQIRKQVEFKADGKTRTDITSTIFPLSPSAEQNVLIQGGISPHLATIDPPLRSLLDETKAYVKGPDFELVWGACLERAFEMVMKGVQAEVFGEASVDPDAPVPEEGRDEQRERLAGILPGLARWCHPALFGLPNELVEGLSNMREVAGLSAIIYSSYDPGTVQ